MYACFFRTSHWLYLCRHRLHAAAALKQPAASLPSRPRFPAVLTCFTCLLPYDYKSRNRLCVSNSGAVFETLSRQTLLSEDRQCYESWRDAELRVPAAVWRIIRWPHPVQVLIATTTVAGHHRPFAARPTKPAVRSVVSSTCHDASAATRLLLVASSIFWVTFSVVYYAIDFFSFFTR